MFSSYRDGRPEICIMDADGADLVRPSMSAIARIVVLLVGVYLLALGASSLLAPGRAGRFLLGFAGSARAHYLELALRLVAGAALVSSAPRMAFSTAFFVFGWVLLATTAVLLAIPWRWHRRFAERTVPRAVRHIRWIGVVSVALGGLVLASV